MAYVDAIKWLEKNEEGKKHLDDILNEVRAKGLETKTVRDKYKDYEDLKAKAEKIDALLPVLKEHGLDDSDIAGSIKNLSKNASELTKLAPENAELLKQLTEMSKKVETLTTESVTTKERATKRTQAALTSKLAADLKGKVGGAETAAKVAVYEGLIGMDENDTPYFKGDGDSVVDYAKGLESYINGHAEKLANQSGGADTNPSGQQNTSTETITRKAYFELPVASQSKLSAQNVTITD